MVVKEVEDYNPMLKFVKLCQSPHIFVILEGFYWWIFFNVIKFKSMETILIIGAILILEFSLLHWIISLTEVFESLLPLWI